MSNPFGVYELHRHMKSAEVDDQADFSLWLSCEKVSCLFVVDNVNFDYSVGLKLIRKVRELIKFSFHCSLTCVN